MIEWAAVYEDGTVQDNQVYADIDREHLAQFIVMEDGLVAYQVDVPKGTRLVYRQRSFMDTTGYGGLAAILVSLENEDRTEIDMHLIEEKGVSRHKEYGDDALTSAPVLYDYEVIA